MSETTTTTTTTITTTITPINIIIPMGGVGARFQKDQFRYPKPLVSIVGYPMLFWLIDNLNIQREDTVYIAIMDYIDDQFALGARVQRQYPKLNIKVVVLNFETRGAAETLFITLQQMNQEELSRRTLSLDCDTFYFCDILTQFRELSPHTSASYYFEDAIGGKPIFSYLRLSDDGTNRILEVKEKAAISTHANTGAYGFASGEVLLKYCTRVLDDAVGSLGEYYTSSVMELMLRDNQWFQGIYVPKFICVGTPTQLTEFLRQIKDGSFSHVPKRRFCFDLTNTLISDPLIESDYTTCQPIEKTIRLVRQLKEAGHFISIWTTQPEQSQQSQQQQQQLQEQQLQEQILNRLKQLNIPFDEIGFNKPLADIYIDDRGVNSMIDTEKEIGWLLEDESSPTRPQRKCIRNFVPARQVCMCIYLSIYVHV